MRGRLALIILGGGSILCIALGIRQSFGLFMGPISHSLGLGREVFALAIAMQNILWGLAQPISGMIADRFGSARVILTGTLVYALGLFVMSGATQPLTLQLGGGLLIGLGLSATSFAVVLGAVGRLAPPEVRSQALALASAGGALGQFLMIPIGQNLLTMQGWQASLFFLALLALLMAPSALFLRGRSTSSMQDPESLYTSPIHALRGALDHAGYRRLTAGFFVCGFHVVFIAVHLPTYLTDQGLPMHLGASALTAIGFANIFGTYFWGHLGGVFRKRNVLASLYLLRAIVLTLFVLLPKTQISVLAFAAAMGLLWLGTVPLTSGVVAQIYGPRYLGTLFGMVFLGHQVGAFVGAWLPGFVFDATGSYEPMWVLAIALSLMATVLHLRLNDQPVAVPLPAKLSP
jgi:predicted MFS family arabinose efflux permease